MVSLEIRKMSVVKHHVLTIAVLSAVHFAQMRTQFLELVSFVTTRTAAMIGVVIPHALQAIEIPGMSCCIRIWYNSGISCGRRIWYNR